MAFYDLKNSVMRKRAGVFSGFFFLWACEPNSPEIVISEQRETVQQSVLKQTEPFLTRAVYHTPALNLQSFTEPEQESLLRDLFEGLVIFDRKGEIIPAQAAHWHSDDGKVWLFVLRENIKWSNGEPVTAQDFVRSWQALVQLDTPLKQYLSFLNLAYAKEVIDKKEPIEKLGIKALDDRRLQITLTKPIPYLPKMLAHIALLPQYSDGQKQVSNGAYHLREQEANHILLEKNPYYWGKENVAFTKTQYRVIPPQQSIDDIDVLIEPKQANLKPVFFPQLCTYFYEFNLSDPYLQHNKVRKALVSMISQTEILQRERLPMLPNHFFVPKNMQLEIESQWQNTYIEQLLQQYQISERQPLQIKLLYDQGDIHSDLAQRLIQSLSQSDLVRVSGESVSWQQLQERRSQGNFQLIRSGWCADYNDPSAFFNLLHSKNPDNKLKLAQPKIDELLEKTLTIVNAISFINKF